MPGKQGENLRPIQEEGFLSMAEVAIGTLVISLLLVTAVLTLRVTERGTVSDKKRQDALDLAKGKAEDMKSYLGGETWGNMIIDQRFPPTQTPMVTSYNAYSPQTITMGKNQYILKPEVRYVYSDATSLLQYVPTPGTAATPEYGDMVRIRVDAYYGPVSEWVPLPTAEAVSNTANRMVYTNLLTNKIFDVSSTNSINGHVYGGSNPCPGFNPEPVGIGGVVVGIFEGAEQIQTAITDSSGFFQFQSVPVGTYYIEIVSEPGYDPINGFSCNYPEPVTISSTQGVTDIWLGSTPIQVWNYYGVVAYAPGVPQPLTPTPVIVSPTPTIVPVPNAIVFSNDGNSLPVTASSSGAYTITGVRSTPVAGHSYDRIQANVASPTPVMAENFNCTNCPPPGTVFQSFSIGSATFVGPITLFVNSAIANTMPVTFVILDNDGPAVIPSAFYPITLKVADGSASPPAVTLTSPSTSVTLNVQMGAPFVTVNLKNNASTIGFTTFSQAINVDASVTMPVTLDNFEVGSCAGTVAGMGASFDYTQFKVLAQDTNGQYTYQIPVSYDGASTFGTFNYTSFRTPNISPYNRVPVYTFSINSGGNYSSTQEDQAVSWDGAVTLASPLELTALNVYMAVTVTQKGTAYPYGSWVSAQMWPSGTAPSAPPTTGLGNGFATNFYYSGLTKGDGTCQIQVELDKGGATTYTVTAQIVDPTSYAVTQQAQTLTVPVTASYAYPQGVSFNF